jgi:3-hydroxyisobutyrate dehydrogenase-like beta-hydroxyacid dehydrogenase
MTTTLGFIGLGTMGGRIVRRLLAAGYPVAGYNRTPARAQALVDAGMRLCASPREVVEAAEITFSMVTDTAALVAITGGEDGILAGLSPGKLYVDMSTVSPSLTRELAGNAAARGAHMLDAPVSGSVGAAEAGTLVVFIGGDAAALERARPVFECFSQKIIHIGGSGTAITTKIAINLNLAIQLFALFEGLLLAEKSGIPRAQALDALLDSVIASTAMKYRAPLILKMPDEATFTVAMMQKDLQLALDLGRELGVPLRSVELSMDVLAQAQQMGYGEEDFAALFEVLKLQARVE